ncbi:MAG: thiazole synthase [Leptospirales bacterium]|jgi:thiazole synthase
MSAHSRNDAEDASPIATLQAAASARDPNPLVIAGRTFHSRLFVGTGKFSSNAAMASAIAASCSEMVTVALRRIELDRPVDEQDMISAIDRSKVILLPNTSGARNAEEAVRLARLARELGGGEWLKLEVTPDPRYLLPDPVETLKAAEILVKDGFHVLPYMHADPVLALRLQDAGCATVMPLGSPIGSNQGIRTKESIAIIIEQARVPVVVDAGLGAPSHAAEAMELGADAVLVNTALAVANDPAQTARAFALATLAGRLGRLHGVGGTLRAISNEEARGTPGEGAQAGADAGARGKDAGGGADRWKAASASSPLTGFLDEDARKA